MNVCKYLERYACRAAEEYLFENPNGFFFKEPQRRFPPSFPKNGRISLMLRENNLLRGGDRANDSRFLEKYKAYKADTGGVKALIGLKEFLTGKRVQLRRGERGSIPQSEFSWKKKKKRGEISLS